MSELDRFFEQHLAGLEELPRVGRPRLFPLDVVVGVKDFVLCADENPSIQARRR